MNATATADDGSTTPIEVTSAAMVRYLDGNISEEWFYYDTRRVCKADRGRCDPHAE